jgi:hypothetical protein
MADMEGGDVRLDPIDAWLRAAMADAERRGLPRLGPLLEGLAQSTRQLRAAEWNDYVPQGGLARRSPKGGLSAEARSAKPEGGKGDRPR